MRQLIPILFIGFVIASGCTSPEPKPLTPDEVRQQKINGSTTHRDRIPWAQIATGISHTVGIKADGTLWAWGENLNNQLGLGDTINRTLPTKVGTDANWRQVDCQAQNTLAIKTDGTLWAWGGNGWGELGFGDNFLDASSPIQVSAGKNWKQVACGGGIGGGAHTIAVKANGTLWAWGYNYYGQLGLGNTPDPSSPVQVGTDTNWQQVACGGRYSLSIKSDGTLWTWGLNLYG